MPRKIKNVRLDFRLEFAELPRSTDGAVRWGEVYDVERPLRVEIGVGNSDFLIEIARRVPEFNYLGFEYCMRRVIKFLKQVHRGDIGCIRVLPIDVTRHWEQLFAAESIDHFYINHPDPWPKRRHAKHRLVRQQNAPLFTRFLRSGGGISLRTDAPQYAEQMLAVLDAADELENLSGHGSFADMPFVDHLTPFEEKFVSAGERIYYLEYVKR